MSKNQSNTGENPTTKLLLTVGQRIWHNYSEYVVVGETSRSWLIKYKSQVWGDPTKLAKSQRIDHQWCLTETEWTDWLYTAEHRQWIGEKIKNTWRSNITAEMLRKVAGIIGYDPVADVPERFRSTFAGRKGGAHAE